MDNYEQKYKDALERAKKLQETCDSTAVVGWCEYLFPELKESEDERIKKAIISHLQHEYVVKRYIGDVEYDKWIAWLEKQKDYIKLPNSAYTSNSDVIEFADKYSHTVWEKLMDNFKKIENYSIGCNDVSDLVLNAIINTYNWLEKQGKKLDAELGQSEVTKTSDKELEPKFKVGDWITDDDYDGDYTWKIVEVKPLDYILQSQDGNIVDDTISYVDEHFHLWTIQDAKDGDVLVAHECVVLFKGIDGLNIKCHCTYHYMNNPSFHVNTLQNKRPFRPATRKQQELLFQEMKEAGYEWDAEKKEVKKIEHKMLNADEVIEWMEKHIIEWKGQDLIKTFTPNSPAGKSYIVEQFKEDFGL